MTVVAKCDIAINFMLIWLKPSFLAGQLVIEHFEVYFKMFNYKARIVARTVSMDILSNPTFPAGNSIHASQSIQHGKYILYEITYLLQIFRSGWDNIGTLNDDINRDTVLW